MKQNFKCDKTVFIPNSIIITFFYVKLEERKVLSQF